jgi:hypothetical protein
MNFAARKPLRILGGTDSGRHSRQATAPGAIRGRVVASRPPRFLRCSVVMCVRRHNKAPPAMTRQGASALSLIDQPRCRGNPRPHGANAGPSWSTAPATRSGAETPFRRQGATLRPAVHAGAGPGTARKKSPGANRGPSSTRPAPPTATRQGWNITKAGPPPRRMGGPGQADQRAALMTFTPLVATCTPVLMA